MAASLISSAAGLPLDPQLELARSCLLRADGTWVEGMLHVPLNRPSPSLLANAHYFGVAAWAEQYLRHCHRDPLFRERWQAAMAPLGGQLGWVGGGGCGLRAGHRGGHAGRPTPLAAGR